MNWKMRPLGWWLLVLATAVSIVGCGRLQEAVAILPDPVRPSTAEPTSGILFVTERHVVRDPTNFHQNWELYLIQPDGSGLTRLTDNEVVDSSPTWSPDGRQLAYRSRRDGSADIFIMDINGRNVRNLIKDPVDSIFDDFYPRWNPTRDMLAIYTDRFYSPEVGCAWHRLAVMPTSGGMDNIRVLDALLTEQETLAWHPNGHVIVFSSRCDFAKEQAISLFAWDIDSDAVWPIVEDGTINSDPAFSPDGRFLAYQSTRDSSGADIYIMDWETGESRNLTNWPGKDSHPSWSPDGSQIAFVTDRDGNDEIYVINSDGSNPTRLTFDPARDFEPVWSPIE